MRGKVIIHGLLFLLLANHPAAQDKPVFIPLPDRPLQYLSASMQWFADPSGKLTMKELLENEAGYIFVRSPMVTSDPGVTVWAKLVMVPGFSSDSFFIGLTHQNLPGFMQGNDRSSIWITEGGKIVHHYETGTYTPLSERPYARPINHNLFPVSLRPGRSSVIYIRLQRIVNFTPLQTRFALQHISVLQTNPVSAYKLAWFYTGMMFILFIFGLVFLMITREKPFIWFTAIACILCLHMQLLEPENSLTVYFLPDHPALQFPLFTILTMLFSIFILQFTRSFAQTKKMFPHWDTGIRIVMAYTGLMNIVSIICMWLIPAAQIPGYLILITFPFNIVIAIRLIISSDLYARWIGFALMWLFIFQTFGILWNHFLLPFWFPNPWMIAQAGMMIILFFALGYRFKQSAKEKAEAAKILEMDSLRSRFFANISHEFRTPLTLMLGPLKHMEEQELGQQQQKKYIAIMRRNGDRLLQLINQLLDLSKLDNSKMLLHISRCDISGILTSVTSSFENMAEIQQVTYQVHFPEKNIIGFCDRDKLEKIIVNLLSNAFRFTPAGGMIRVIVSQDQNKIHITVQDDGPGINQNQLSRIFDRFYQVMGTEAGTGIGLALVKELLELHKGQISVQSKPGKGSIFRISLPVDAETYLTGDEDLSMDPHADIMEDPSLPLVLVAEDNPDLQQYIQDILLPHFHVQLAGNGEDAFKKAITYVPDCIVSDVLMPKMNGIELCTGIKKESVTSHIPFILLTAKAGSKSRIEGLETGADDYLVKPFDAAELVIRIRNLIELRKQLRERYSQIITNIEPESLIEINEQPFIVNVKQAIEENIDDELFGVTELAERMHLSRSQLHRKLKALTGQAPNEILRNYRLEKALQLLRLGAGNVSEVAFQTGFSSSAYFSKCFSERYGHSPAELKKKV